MANVNTELMMSLHGGHFVEDACSSDTSSVYSIDKCYWAGTTPTCQVVIAHSPVYGKVLFLDKEIQSAESDEAIYHEHLVHPVLAATAHIPNKRVLIVGGGEGATAREVLKWNPESVARVDWVDIDGPLVDLCRRHLSWASDEVYNDSRLTYHAADIRQFLKGTYKRYDVIILDLPDPDVDELRKNEGTDEYLLYSKQFWYELLCHITPYGAIVSHTGPIAPGFNPTVRRAGLTWIESVSESLGKGRGYPYHVTIPSFQGDWGFWMSVPPVDTEFPQGLAVMDVETQRYAFTWPKYWNNPYIGHAA
jgi:spermidine synthase